MTFVRPVQLVQEYLVHACKLGRQLIHYLPALLHLRCLFLALLLQSLSCCFIIC